MNESILELLHKLQDDDAHFVRARLEPHLPKLLAAGVDLWTVAVSRMDTRFNLYLSLNAPELWRDLDVPAWERVMLSIRDRSYRESDFVSTGRFDDIKLLCHLLGIDAVDWYFRISAGKPDLQEARTWTKRHVHACPFMYLPLSHHDPMDDLDETVVTLDQLTTARERLMRQADYLRPMLTDEEAIREEAQHLSD